MSADHWSRCPKCDLVAADLNRAAAEKVAALYGKVSEAEYLAAKRNLLEAEDADLADDTMRWDYEFYGAEDGALNIDFSCSCRKCGYEFNYRNAVDMEVV